MENSNISLGIVQRTKTWGDPPKWNRTPACGRPTAGSLHCDERRPIPTEAFRSEILKEEAR